MVGSLTVVEARSTEDMLGWTIMCARHLEKRQYDLVEHDMECYPELKTCGKNAAKPSKYLSEPELAKHLKHVKDHAVELAREDIGNDIANLRSSGDDESNERIQQKEHILKKLRRLSPGETNQLKCVVDEEGNLHTEAKNMAKALCKHWREVFCKVPCNDPKLREWMDILFEKAGDARWNTGLPTEDPSAWKILRSHIVKAVKQAKNSMPGPDGIPAMAYIAMGDMMIDLLEDMIGVLSSEEAEDVLTEAFSSMTLEERHAFNASILCCLPKKPSGVHEEAGEFYHPDATRPLNISNVDNRLLASAARLAWEPKFEKWISAMQRGFLKGRQMLHNVLDIDFEAMRVSLKTEHGLLVLFDFRAAFPSVSHEFLTSCLQYLGLPANVMNFIRIMYNNNRCTIRIQGEDFPGFAMEGGVRQGRPLSPLLFAVCVDLLLRRLQHDIPGITVRAFADDIASIVHDWWAHGPAMEKLFSEFASISNLCLNISKTVCMPLWPKGADELKESLATFIPSWAQVKIDSKGSYLGFAVGPGSTNLSWVKPLEKFQTRVRQWSKLGKGMQFGAMAYNTFALSTLLFIAQLEGIPCEVSESERKHVVKMFPGFGHWIEPCEVWYMKEMFGCAKSAQPLDVIAKASKLRLAILGCHFDRKQLKPHHLRRHGHDNIFSRVVELNSCKNNTDHMDRLMHYRQWYANNHCVTLVNNVKELQDSGIHVHDIFHTITNKQVRDLDEDDLVKIKVHFQREVVRVLKSKQKPDPVECLRHNLERWFVKRVPFGLTGPPGHICPMIHRRFLRLATVAPPRIHFAMLHTLLNGWCTHRRRQKRRSITNKCVFRCGEGAEDSIEHYSRCSTVQRVSKHVFRLAYPPEQALNIWLLNSYYIDCGDNILNVGLLVYGAYNAFNTLRHSPVTDANQAYHCIVQHCKEGALGHPKCMTHLDSRWRQEVAHII